MWKFSISCPACSALLPFKHRFCGKESCPESMATGNVNHTHTNCETCNFHGAMEMNIKEK